MRNYIERILMKAEFRQYCLKKLHALPSHNKRYRDYRINNALAALLGNLHVNSILFYWPLPFEADIRESVKRSRKKMHVYLPFMVGESFKMVPFRLPLKSKAFGLFESGNTTRTIKNIDIAIVPAIGVDANGKRIGFGKGMYDRFFPTLKKRPFTIFIQSEQCCSKEAICDDFDIECDLLLTPGRCYAMKRIRDAKRDTVRGRNLHFKRRHRFFHF